MTTKTTTKTMIATAALALGLLGAGPARAWEPDPVRGPGYYTGVVRLLDIGFLRASTYLALTDDPGAFCAANRNPDADATIWFGPAWVKLLPEQGDMSRFLSVAMWAKAQNVQLRVFFAVNANNRSCEVFSFRTCADAAACAYPPPPAGP